MLARLALSLLLCIGIAAPAQAQTQSTIFGAAFAGPAAPASLFAISPSNGSASLIGSIGFNQVGGIDFGPDGRLYGVAVVAGAATLITINTTTGAGTVVGSLGIGGAAAQDIAFRPSDGTLFAYIQGNIFTINRDTGVATLVGSTGGFPDGNAIAFSSGTLLLGNTQGGTNGSLQSVNQTTGAVTPIVNFTFGPGFTPANNSRTAAMKFDPTTGALLAAVVEGNGAAVRFLGVVDPATGIVTDIGPTVAGLDAIAIRSAGVGVVPTLSEWSLIALFAMIFGLALVPLSRMRNQAS
jgi:hypothetical protein